MLFFIGKQHVCSNQLQHFNLFIQGSHCIGKTGKIVKNNARQGKHREFENFGKHREFENFRMILKSNSHLHYFIHKIHREKYKLHRENTGNLNWKREWEPGYSSLITDKP